MNNWTSAVFALIGVVIGGLISYFSNLHKTRVEKIWDRDRNILTKLEELYAIVEDVKDGYMLTASQGMMKAHHNKMPDSSNKIPVAKMKMLIVLYAPEATRLINDFDKAWNEFSKHYGMALTSSNLQKSQAQTLSKQLFISAEDIGNVCARIQTSTLEIVKSLKVSRQ